MTEDLTPRQRDSREFLADDAEWAGNDLIAVGADSFPGWGDVGSTFDRLATRHEVRRRGEFIQYRVVISGLLSLGATKDAEIEIRMFHEADVTSQPKRSEDPGIDLRLGVFIRDRRYNQLLDVPTSELISTEGPVFASEDVAWNIRQSLTAYNTARHQRQDRIPGIREGGYIAYAAQGWTAESSRDALATFIYAGVDAAMRRYVQTLSMVGEMGPLFELDGDDHRVSTLLATSLGMMCAEAMQTFSRSERMFQSPFRVINDRYGGEQILCLRTLFAMDPIVIGLFRGTTRIRQMAEIYHRILNFPFERQNYIVNADPSNPVFKAAIYRLAEGDGDLYARFLRLWAETINAFGTRRTESDELTVILRWPDIAPENYAITTGDVAILREVSGNISLLGSEAVALLRDTLDEFYGSYS